MKVLKPKFWEKKNSLLSLILFPFAFFLQLLNKIRELFTSKISFKIPIICVGNIYLGGTGKTPLSIFIAQELLKYKKKPAVIKKYYPQHIDEHELIKDKLGSLFLDRQRSKAIYKAENENYNVAILDDGFQDHTIIKKFNILCFNSIQLIGNGMTIPAGPLRESFNSLKKSNVVVINGNKNEIFEKKIYNISKEIKIYYSRYIPMNINEFKNKKLFAFAGIGNPKNFFKLLVDNNLDVKSKIEFPDHYNYSKREIEKIKDISVKNNWQIITTEKDYFRIKKFGFENIKFLKIELEILEKDKFISQLLNAI